jgi:hypothetical protein
MVLLVSRDSSVAIATGCGLDDRRTIPSMGNNIFSVLHSVQTGSEAHPASYPIGTARPFFPGVMQSGREADHLPPSSAELK